MTTRVLDLGCGQASVARQLAPSLWGEDVEIVTVDADPQWEPDVVADVRDLPEELTGFDEIVAAHVLEHLPRQDIMPALRHWRERLVDGGILHLFVPDLQWAAREMALNDRPPIPEIVAHLYGSASSGWEQHFFGFVAGTLRTVLNECGYRVRVIEGAPYIIALPNRAPVRARQIYAAAHKLNGQ